MNCMMFIRLWPDCHIILCYHFMICNKLLFNYFRFNIRQFQQTIIFIFIKQKAELYLF
jgi:hypothetical protein